MGVCGGGALIYLVPYHSVDFREGSKRIMASQDCQFSPALWEEDSYGLESATETKPETLFWLQGHLHTTVGTV